MKLRAFNLFIPFLAIFFPVNCAHHYNSDIISATRNNDIKSIKQSIKYGADINIKDKNGETALVHATRTGEIKVIAALLESGAK